MFFLQSLFLVNLTNFRIIFDWVLKFIVPKRAKYLRRKLVWRFVLDPFKLKSLQPVHAFVF